MRSFTFGCALRTETPACVEVKPHAKPKETLPTHYSSSLNPTLAPQGQHRCSGMCCGPTQTGTAGRCCSTSSWSQTLRTAGSSCRDLPLRRDHPPDHPAGLTHRTHHVPRAWAGSPLHKITQHSAARHTCSTQQSVSHCGGTAFRVAWGLACLSQASTPSYCPGSMHSGSSSTFCVYGSCSCPAQPLTVVAKAAPAVAAESGPGVAAAAAAT
jgi:hypothetical protein